VDTYQDYTYQSPFFVKRWLHQKRYSDTRRLLNLQPHDTVLDYGCGDGYFLRVCSEVVPAENLVGYEPDHNMYNHAVRALRTTGIQIANTLDSLKHGPFTKVVCLETAEHLVDKELNILLTNIRKLLAQNGTALISVPIETGIPALFKNTFRILKGHIPDNLTFMNFWRMVFGVSIPRSTSETLEHGQYIYSHIGFSHGRFEDQLERNFLIESKHYSPFNSFGSMVNNTIYYVCVHM
jgi:SAM-dependent methyltransferase